MPIRTLIVDDEQLAREELVYLVEPMDELEVVGQAANGLEAVAAVERLKPDLVLLDVQMPGLDGFQVVEKLDASGELPQIVFVTAYDDYALRAFEVNAVDYLLKPVERERLAKAIDRVTERLGMGIGVTEKIEQLLDSLKRPRPLTRLPVKEGGRLILLDTNDIVYAYVSGGTVHVVTDDLEGTLNYRTLEELAADLDPERFSRVHRGYLANLGKVAEIIPWFSGTYHLRMSDKKRSEIPMSRQQARKLRKVLKW